MRSLLPYYVTNDTREATNMVAFISRDIRKGDMDAALRRLQTFLSTIPQCDHTKYEGHYQQVFYIIFSLLGYYVDVEVRTSRGRVDVVLRTEATLYVMESPAEKVTACCSAIPTSKQRSGKSELGCPIEKTMVTPNGIRVENLQNIPGKTEEDEGKINIGAVLRVTPIKDVKTMIQAFGFAKEKDDRLKLWIMGPWEEDREYAEECFQLVSDMEIPDVVFTGRINIRDYLGRMDVTILTSISEGQPLTILESYAAHKPVIATDVGNCYGLIYGESDDFGAAGIVTHIMNIEEIAQAMLDMAANEKMRLEMGETGYRRVMEKYRVEYMQKTYWEIYRDLAEQMGLEWKEESVKLPDKEK